MSSLKKEDGCRLQDGRHIEATPKNNKKVARKEQWLPGKRRRHVHSKEWRQHQQRNTARAAKSDVNSKEFKQERQLNKPSITLDQRKNPSRPLGSMERRGKFCSYLKSGNSMNNLKNKE